MKYFIEFFLKRPLLVKIILIAIFLLAVKTTLDLNRNVFPEVDLATMIITTEYPGASPKDVEQNVTRLIEEELGGIAGIKKYTSVSSENVSLVKVEIDIDYPDQDEVKDEVRRAVERVTDLPPEILKRPQVRDLKSSELPVMMVGVSGDVDYGTLRQMAKIVKKDLKDLKGVSLVDDYAYRDYQFQVDLIPEKVSQYYVSLNDILFALENRNVRSTGGSLESYKTQRNILTLSEFESVEEVSEVIVRSNFDGENVRIKDIATVSLGFEDEKIRSGFNGERGISLVVKKTSNTDILDLVDRIKSYVQEKQKVMAEGVHLYAVNDGSVEVRNRLEIVRLNGIFGFILVFLVLLLFLDLRISFWVAMSIPTAFAVSLISLPYFDVDLNAISLAAMIIVLGMLVDDAVVVSENIFSHRQKGTDKFKDTVNGVLEVSKPVIATVLTTCCAFAPIFAMTGVMGRFVYVIPVVVITALVGSLLDCFTILPSHLMHSKADISSSEKGWRNYLFKSLAKPYRATLRKVLRFRYIIIPFAFFFLIFSMWWAKEKVGTNLFPADGARTLHAFVELEEDKNFDATDDVIQQLEKIMESLPESELESHTVFMGTAEADPLAIPVGREENRAYMTITLTPHSEREREADLILEDIRQRAQTVTGAKKILFEIKKPGPPAGKPIEFHIHADNNKDRKRFVDLMVEELEGMEGVTDIEINEKLGREEYKLDIDYGKLAELGLTVNDVASTLRIAFDGVAVTSIVKNNEEIDVRVRFPKEYRHDINNVLNLVIRNRENRLIPLKNFAQISTIRADTAIYHTNGDVTTTITAQTDSVKILPETAIQRLLEKYTPQLADYPEVSFSYGGETEKTKESMQSLFIAFLSGIVAIYLILTILFNSATQPLLILMAIPLSLIGVIWAFYFHGQPFSFLGLIGIVGLSGVVVNDSLVMFDFINRVVKKRASQLTDRIKRSEMLELVVDGASKRLRPVIITSVTTFLGLIPTAYGIGGSDPFIAPMVLAIAWGILFGTLLILFILPCLYFANEDALLFLRKCKKMMKFSKEDKLDDNKKEQILHS